MVIFPKGLPNIATGSILRNKEDSKIYLSRINHSNLLCDAKPIVLYHLPNVSASPSKVAK